MDAERFIPDKPTTSKPVVLGLAALLMLATVAVYWPVRGFEFINYDDPEYWNDQVKSGLSWDGVKWAFSAGHFRFWHPLTWLSLMLDAQLFGPGASGPHVTNLIFHVANVLLVFSLLRRLTGATWRGFCVAALFALHPLRVESVAWVTERKDVLSTFFGLLSLIYYARYAGQLKVQNLKAKMFYGAALLFFALGLMSKPMLVTWPFVMLLMDWWPLQRFSSFKFQVSSWGRLVVEKIPFFAFSAALGLMTFLLHSQTGAVANVPLLARVENALVSYSQYLGKTVWPVKLAVFYPPPGEWSWSLIVFSLILISAITAVCFALRRSTPAMLFGWCWFSATLLPVIGLVQAGEQSFADRFSYIPLTGFFIALVWACADWMTVSRWRKYLVIVGAGFSLVACAWCSRIQLGYWRDSKSLFRHALAVTENNYVAYNCLGLDLFKKKQTEIAFENFHRALAINPGSVDALNNLGIALADSGNLDAAITNLQAALQISPNNARTHNNLGVVLMRQGRMGEAVENLETVVQWLPHDLNALNNLAEAHFQQGTVLAKRDDIAGAIGHWRKVVALRPDWPPPLNSLAWVLATDRRQEIRNGGEAVKFASHAVTAAHAAAPGLLDTLAAAYAEAGRFDDAVRCEERALQLAGASSDSRLVADLQAHLAVFQRHEPWRD